MKEAGMTGRFEEFVIPVNGIIDAHMHIMSGNCSPLPLAWGKFPEILVPAFKYAPRSWLNDLVNAKVVKDINKYIILDQTCKIHDSAIKLGEYVKTLNTTYNFGINNLGKFLLELALKIIDFQRKLVSCELHLGLDTVYYVLDYIKNEIEAGLDLAANVDYIAQNVLQKIESARRRLHQNTDKTDEHVELFKINDFFITLSIKILELALVFAEKLLQILLKGTHALKEFAQVVEETAGYYITKLKEFLKSTGEGILSVTEEVYEHGAKSILYCGAAALYSIVRTITSAKDEIVNKAVTLYESAFKGVDALESWILSNTSFLQTQAKPTIEIGNIAVQNMPFKIQPFHPLICLPMDMEYAHLDGYNGEPIYRKVSQRYYIMGLVPTAKGEMVEAKIYLEPDYKPGQDNLKNVQSEPFKRYYRYDRDKYGKKGPAKWMYAEENRLFETWKQQRDNTVACVMKHPWELFPFYHYEPRRWMKNWKKPFSSLVYDKTQSLSEKSPRIFLGFKMYPSLGYNPLDEHCPNLKEYYTECAKQKIPIMTHCSPGGMYTHERRHYLGYYKTKYPWKMKCAAYSAAIDEVEPAIQFFEENIASPLCWKPVLDLPGCSELKLCLAHFGGGVDAAEDKLYSGWAGNSRVDSNKNKYNYAWRDAIVDMITSGSYPNLYTDFSCLGIADMEKSLLELLQKILEKDRTKGLHLIRHIMFGTDWYMTEIFGSNYKQFYDDSYTTIKNIDTALRQKGLLKKTDPTLWQWFSNINPFEFYNFYNLREEIAKTMKKWGIKDTTINKGVKATEFQNNRIKKLVENVK